jgi:hypothetical protein
MPSADARREPLGRGDEEIVTDELHMAEAFARELPAMNVVLAERVLEGDDRVVPAPPLELGHELEGA